MILMTEQCCHGFIFRQGMVPDDRCECCYGPFHSKIRGLVWDFVEEINSLMKDIFLLPLLWLTMQKFL